MSAHTPGPWTVVESTGGWTLRSEAVGRGYYAAIGSVTQRDPHPVHGGGISHETAEANARLIAAAPELLDVLRTTRGNLLSIRATQPGVTVYDAWLSVVESAIARAEGR